LSVTVLLSRSYHKINFHENLVPGEFENRTRLWRGKGEGAEAGPGPPNREEKVQLESSRDGGNIIEDMMQGGQQPTE
jgi:hypothetical protein